MPTTVTNTTKATTAKDGNKSPARAKDYLRACNAECEAFATSHLKGVKKGSDEMLIKLLSLAKLGKKGTDKLYEEMRRIDADTPHDAFRRRMATLGIWRQPIVKGKAKPVNVTAMLESGNADKVAAGLAFECLRKMHKARLDKEEALRLDNEAIAAGFKNAAAKIEHEEEQARLTALTQTAVMVLPDPPAEIVVPADVLATVSEVPVEDIAGVKIATGPSNSELLNYGRELLRRLAVGGLAQDDVDDITISLAGIFDNLAGSVVDSAKVAA